MVTTCCLPFASRRQKNRFWKDSSGGEKYQQVLAPSLLLEGEPKAVSTALGLEGIIIRRGNG
jgi:hypothetical protein